MSYPKQEYFPAKPIPVPGMTQTKMDIWQAINFNNYNRVKEIITEDAKKIEETGWNDMYPLHHACLRGQLEIVQLLVQSGGDPNCKTSFEETPLHYACRSGHVPIVHWLCLNKANHKCKDKKGRCCMHFAAMGSSITVMHYLSSQLGHQYDITDNTGQNALHIASEKNNLILYSYLLRNNRVDPSSSDLKGITPMHIVAEKGYGEMAWLLLNVGKCGLLQLKNHAGYTPVKLAYCGKTEEHRNLAKQLEWYSKRKPNVLPIGPIYKWFFLLLFPFVTLGMTFVLTSYLNGLKGYFTFAMLLFVSGFTTKQSHRLRHICRWSNPIFFGAFSGGIIHCTIAFYIKITPQLWPCPWTILMVSMFVFFCYYLLYHLVKEHPGVTKFAKLDPISGNEMTIMEIAERKCQDFDFCPFSECIKNERSKYCRICEKTVIDMDHHCLFLNTCIADKNHKSFVVFILTVMVLQFSLILTVICYITTLPLYNNSSLSNFPISTIISNIFHTEPWLFSLALVSLCSFIWESTLIYDQTRNIANDKTIYSAMKRPKTKTQFTTMQKMKNILKFFLKSETTSSFVDKRPILYA